MPKVIWEQSASPLVPRLTPHHLNHSSDGSRTFAQLRCKLPIGYIGAPHIRPLNYPLPWTDPQTQLGAYLSASASSPDRSDLPSQTAAIGLSDQPFCHSVLDRQTQTKTNRWFEGMFDDYRPLSLYRQRIGLIMINRCDVYLIAFLSREILFRPRDT